MIREISIIHLGHHGFEILFEYKIGFAPLVNEVQKVSHPEITKISFLQIFTV